MREIVIIGVYYLPPSYFFIPCASVEIAPFDRYSYFYGPKDVFPRRLCVFLGANNFKKNMFIIYRKNTRNSPFPQCKTSIGNNSGSITDRAVNFAYSMEF